MGAGIAASPHLHRAKDLPVFASLTTRRPSAFRSWLTRSGVASNRGPARRQVLDFPRPFLGRVLPRRLSPEGNRELREEHQLFRRLFRWSDLELSSLLIAIRWRSVLPSPAAPSCRCRPSGEAGTSVPITHVTCSSLPSRESEKSESKPVDNGDIGRNWRFACRDSTQDGESPRRIAIGSVRASPHGCRFVPACLVRTSARIPCPDP
jgi:hypothetical protein